jgi:hypothetical protein
MDTGTETGTETGTVDSQQTATGATRASTPKRRTAPTRLSTKFTAPERQAIGALRDRYSRGHDQFNAREFERLRFLHWLHQTGRLDP